MKIEILSIGDELLKGITVNTNAAFISHALHAYGYDVCRQVTVTDEPMHLDTELRAALARNAVIIATGGLGPTLDDRTRKIAACLFGSDFHYDEQIAADLKRRFGEGLTSLKDQATVPTKAHIIQNPVGTAPGFIFTTDGKTLILLPGVPFEMQPMLVEQVIPYLLKKHPPKQPKALRQFFLCLLNENQVDPILRELNIHFPEVEAGIYPGYGTLTVSLVSKNAAQLDAFEKELRTSFANHLYSTSSQKIEEELHTWFIANKRKLALAESCTGGMMAERLTAIPGASDYFLGSFVVYSNALKVHALGVSEATLKKEGAVSEQAVQEMLGGLFKHTEADYAIAVSGIAGPTGGTPDKPVGTVWIGTAKRNEKADISLIHAKGNRQTIILTATQTALAMLWRHTTKA